MRGGISGCPIELSAAITACRIAASGSPSSPMRASNASASPIRASAPAAATASSRIAERRDQRRRRTPIADPAERDRRRLTGFEIFGAQLLGEQRDDAAAVAHQRLDDLRPHRAVAEQTGQRALHRLALQPSQHLREPGEAIGSHALHRIQDRLRAGGADAATHQRGDVVAGAVAALVAIVQAGQRVGDHFGRRVGRVEQPHQRHGHVLVAELAERLDHRRAQQLVGEQAAPVAARRPASPSRLNA